MMQKVGIWLIVALVVFTFFKQFDKPRAQDQLTYSQFMEDAKVGKIKRVDVQGRNLASNWFRWCEIYHYFSRRYLDGWRFNEIWGSGNG
jgi:ATP-dependent Zn protease